MNTLTAIRSRKSPETFLSTPLKRETITAIAEAGNYAPIFGHIHFTVLTDPELFQAVNDRSIEMMKQSGNEFAEKMANTPGYSATRNAQAMILLSAPGGHDAMGFAMANVSCAAENMCLAATELGIGSRFMMGPVMALSQEPIRSALCLPEGYEPLVAVALGNVEGKCSQRKKEMNNVNWV